ncbi:MAG: 4'-phosphopantetheinyl transferase family protein, partial [Angustibacter sp.]
MMMVENPQPTIERHPPVPAEALIALHEHQWAPPDHNSQSIPGAPGPTEYRRAEFAAGRRALQLAGESLGVPLTRVPARADGAPDLPPGVVGSITHTRNYAAAAVAPKGAITTLGIDAEPWRELRWQTVKRIATPEEWRHLEALKSARPDIPWGCILFTAQESTFKAFSFLGIHLGFRQSSIRLGVG